MSNDLQKTLLNDFYRRHSKIVPEKSVEDLKRNIIDAAQFVQSYEKLIEGLIKKTYQTESEYMEFAKYFNDKSQDAVFRGISYSYRFLKNPTEKQQYLIKDINTKLYYEGLLIFLSKESNEYRYKHLEIEQFPLMVFAKYEPNVLVADRIVKDFNKQNNNVLKFLFDKMYKEELEAMVENTLKKSFLQRAKNESYFYNIFAAGFVLGMVNDFESKDFSD